MRYVALVIAAFSSGRHRMTWSQAAISPSNSPLSGVERNQPPPRTTND